MYDIMIVFGFLRKILLFISNDTKVGELIGNKEKSILYIDTISFD